MNELRFCQKHSIQNCMAVQEHNKHCSEILKELKKIFKKNLMMKRKLKYFFKKYDFSKHVSKFFINDHYPKQNNLNFSNDKFCANMQGSSNKLFISRLKTTSDQANNFYQTENLYGKNTSSLVECKFQIQDIDSKKHLPALSVLKGDIIYSNDNMVHNVSSRDNISVIKNVSEKSSNFDDSDDRKLNNHWKCKRNTKIIFTASSNDILYENYISPEKTVFSPKIESSFSKSPLKYFIDIEKSPKNRCYSPYYLIKNNVMIEEDTKVLEENTSLIDSLSSSTSQILTLDSTKDNKHHKNDSFQNVSCNCTIKDQRELSSPSKTPRKTSESPYRNSNEILKRDWSDGSTCLSSPTQSHNSSSRSSRSPSTNSQSTSRLFSTNSSPSRSPSIPRRYGSPSFLDRRRITSARKRPIPYHRPTPSPASSPSSKQSSESSISNRSRKSSLNYSEE